MTNKKQKKKANKNNSNNNATDTKADNTNNNSSPAAAEAGPTATSTVQHSSSESDKQVKVMEKEKEKEKEKEATSVDDDQPAEEPQQKGFKGQAKKDMQAVEGYVAERTEGEGIDEAKLDKALNIVETVNEEKKRLNDQRLQKQKDAEKIKVPKEHIEFIMKEMEVTKSEADKYLREHKGDLDKALMAMVNAH